MGFLAGKRILITGLLSNRSIVCGIANACEREGAELAFTYVGERFEDRITEFTTKFDNKLVLDYDVSNSKQIVKAFEGLGQYWGHFDGLAYLIGFAPREAIADSFIDDPSRRSSHIAHDISVYSFPVLAKAALPMLSPTTSLLASTYPGAERIIPNYNAMGLAKVPPEADVRYLAGALGPRGIHANGVSAGPIKTLAASGIKDLGKLLRHMEDVTLLRRNVMIEEVGNVAAFLLSNLASDMTGETTYVDYGLNATVGVPESASQG